MTHLEEIDDECTLDGSTKPLLVGELSPYGSNPRRALAPLPSNAAGGRLCRMLNITPTEYLKVFDRANLCVGEWDADSARNRARGLVQSPRAAFVLLGRMVCHAFGVSFAPFTVSGAVRAKGRFVVLPHTSGRCRVWIDLTSAEQEVVCGLLPSRSRP